MDAPEAGEIGGTYGGIPIACVAALAVFDSMKKYDLPGRANAIGATVKAFAQKMDDEYHIVGDIRGFGAMVGVELVKDKKTKEPAGDVCGKIVKECHKRGFIVLSCGLYGNAIRFLMPLTISDSELNEGLVILEQAFAAAIQ
jgi:4-aminobutyrate aminotransferase/(S)-3-amino-2-methylpropionate transaminase